MEISAVYQGVDGAYSQLVLQGWAAGRGLAVKTHGASTYREVAAALAGLRADVGAIPIENAIVGTVREGYDLLAEFDLEPIAEVLLRTDHRLLGVRGGSLEDVREVLAHPLVINECGRFLSSLPHARAIPCEDTGIAAREVARGGNGSIAALAPASAARIYDLDELARDCADDPRTYSRFILVRSRLNTVDAPAPGEKRKTSLIFSLPDAPGTLARALAHLDANAVNLSKLESKPLLGQGSDHTFYADIDGDVRDANVATALGGIRGVARSVTVLGSYDAHVGAPLEDGDGPSSLGSGRFAPDARDDKFGDKPVRITSARVPRIETNSAYPRVDRMSKPDGTFVKVDDVTIGDGTFTIIAGPCSVESREQMVATAQAVKAAGAVMMRGGAFKPRTSPYAFQGLGWEGVDLLAEAGRAAGMPTVSEVMTIDQVERMTNSISMLQVGARNMQNFDLLKAVGRTGHPVLLKRGLSATIEELLAAAEYILSEGNPHVVLCERGIRTFETATRNTLDLSAVPVLRERTHLPVIVDPSHGVGVRRWIMPMARAAKAAGAHGLILEVHPNPPEAKSDKEQALTFADFAAIVEELDAIPTERMHARTGA
jgi:chorismate mutase/prephenate dehydratase